MNEELFKALDAAQYVVDNLQRARNQAIDAGNMFAALAIETQLVRAVEVRDAIRQLDNAARCAGPPATPSEP